jgi:hypothetical protein
VGEFTSGKLVLKHFLEIKLEGKDVGWKGGASVGKIGLQVIHDK